MYCRLGLPELLRPLLAGRIGKTHSSTGLRLHLLAFGMRVFSYAIAEVFYIPPSCTPIHFAVVITEGVYLILLVREVTELDPGSSWLVLVGDRALGLHEPCFPTEFLATEVANLHDSHS